MLIWTYFNHRHSVKMIYNHWNHSGRPDKNFWHRLQISALSEIKTQRNRINCMRLTSPKVHLSVTWSNKQVNNTLIASRQAYIYTPIYIGDQGIVHKIGPRNRHWGPFAKRCINNRTIRHDAKWCQLCIVLERCTFGKVHRMQFILFLCVFILDGALIWRWCQK